MAGRSLLLSRIVRFGAFELDLRAGELRRAGIKLKIQGQPLQVLIILLEHPGDIVTRDQLRARIWAADTFVDFDQALNKAVNKVREVLGDSASAPRYVETLARRGYRFIAPVDFTGAQRTALAADKVRIAVLPLQNLSGDPAQECFSDGMTEEIISHLGRLDPPRLGVIARTSAMQYKNTTKRVAQIGQELDVDYVIEGSIRRVGDQVRITVQLIQADDETHIWAASYNRALADVLAVQGEVSAAIARELACELLPDCRNMPAGWRPSDPENHARNLRGHLF